jgi:hypothetical protein
MCSRSDPCDLCVAIRLFPALSVTQCDSFLICLLLVALAGPMTSPTPGASSGHTSTPRTSRVKAARQGRACSTTARHTAHRQSGALVIGLQALANVSNLYNY